MPRPQSLETSHQKENNELTNTARSLRYIDYHQIERNKKGQPRINVRTTRHDSPQPKRPALSEPPALTLMHLLFEHFHAEPLDLGNLLHHVPLRGREENHRESRSVLQSVEKRPRRSLMRDEVFLYTLSQPQTVRQADHGEFDVIPRAAHSDSALSQASGPDLVGGDDEVAEDFGKGGEDVGEDHVGEKGSVVPRWREDTFERSVRGFPASVCRLVTCSRGCGRASQTG